MIAVFVIPASCLGSRLLASWLKRRARVLAQVNRTDLPLENGRDRDQQREENRHQ